MSKTTLQRHHVETRPCSVSETAAIQLYVQRRRKVSCVLCLAFAKSGKATHVVEPKARL